MSWLNKIFKKKVVPQETTKKPKMSEKDIATAKGEPFVNVLSVELDPDNIGNGAFELDFNEIFVARLIKAGYKGKTDYDIVDQWFVQICHNIVQENFEQWEANFPDQSPRRNNKKNLGDGKVEIS